jgi:glycosyltransferase involved in cell wall biosynthesis
MERVVLTLAKTFTERHCAVRVILPESERALQTQAWFRQSGISPEITPALKHSFGRRRFVGTSQLGLLLQQSTADVVNIHYGMNFPSLNEVLAVRLAGKRCVVSLHAGGGADPPARLQRKLKNRIAASLCSAIISVSAFQAERLIENGVPAKKIRVIPSGVLPPEKRTTKVEARRLLGLPKDAFIVGTACRLTDRKGLADLVRALSFLPHEMQSRAPIFLAVAGEGPERERLENAAFQQLPGRYRFLGLLAETNALYAASDLFVLPSYEESFGLVYIEAALHGIPSVGTTVGGVPETVLAWRTGILVPPHEPTHLAKAIQTMWMDDDLRGRMGFNALRRAQRDFTAIRMAERYESVLFSQASPVEQPEWNDLLPITGLDA